MDLGREIFCFPSACLVACQHPHPKLSLIPSLVSINGWNLLTIKSDHPMNQNKGQTQRCVWLVLSFGWFWRKENIFNLLSFKINNIEGEILFSVNRAHLWQSHKIWRYYICLLIQFDFASLYSLPSNFFNYLYYSGACSWVKYHEPFFKLGCKKIT